MEMSIMRLNFLYYICFAFFHLCLRMEFLKNQKCFLYSGLAGMGLPWLEEEDGVSLKPQWSKTMCHLLCLQSMPSLWSAAVSGAGPPAFPTRGKP